MPNVTVDELRKVICLKDLPDEHLQWIIDRGKVLDYDDGALILKSGDPVDEMIFIIDGKSHFYMNVNGKLVSFFSTHFQWPQSASGQRQVEANQLVAFASKFAEPRIIAGDFNAQVYTTEIGIILQQYYGAWDEAVSKGVATAYPDNPASSTTRSRKSRIDHIFFAKAASGVSVAAAQIPDQRAPGTAGLVTVKIGTTDDKGVRPSDHNFVETTLNLN
jgi:hypothetical protein